MAPRTSADSSDGRRTSSCTDHQAQHVMIGESDVLNCHTIRAASSLLCDDSVQRDAKVMSRSGGVKFEPVAINQQSKLVSGLAGCSSHRRHKLVPGEWQNDPGRWLVRRRIAVVPTSNQDGTQRWQHERKPFRLLNRMRSRQDKEVILWRLSREGSTTQEIEDSKWQNSPYIASSTNESIPSYYIQLRYVNKRKIVECLRTALPPGLATAP